MSLLIRNLSVNLGEKQILKGINLEVKPGTLHAVMGPNGSGKSTLAQALMGNPSYKVKNHLPAVLRPLAAMQRLRASEALQAGKSKVKINNKDIIDFAPDERAREGLFLAFQNPVAIPGVNVANLLRTVYQLKDRLDNKINKKKLHNPALSIWDFNEMLVKKTKELGIPQDFLRRSLNESFSGGEKKKLEMLQAVVLQPKYAIFDEIDTGLDIDALRIVASCLEQLKKEGCGVIVITHYQRILKYAKPDFVHILVKGRIVASDGYKLANEVEKKGYKKWVGKLT